MHAPQLDVDGRLLDCVIDDHFLIERKQIVSWRMTSCQDLGSPSQAHMTGAGAHERRADRSISLSRSVLMVFIVIGVLPGHKGRIGHPDHTHFIGQTPWRRTCTPCPNPTGRAPDMRVTRSGMTVTAMSSGSRS
jgi:hypothetical protein